MASADPTRSLSRRQHSRPRPPGNDAAPSISGETIAAAIRTALAAGGPGKSLCPSEIARTLAAEDPVWRALMPRVRAVAARLAAAGELVVTQRGRLVDPAAVRGPVRYALPVEARHPGARRPGD